MTAIIDYDAGNIKSVEKALLFLGEQVCVTREREKILSADRVILPGVGSFGKAMERIRSCGLEDVIKEIVSRGTPFLGICLGLQLLFERSEECGGGCRAGHSERRNYSDTGERRRKGSADRMEFPALSEEGKAV